MAQFGITCIRPLNGFNGNRAQVFQNLLACGGFENTIYVFGDTLVFGWWALKPINPEVGFRHQVLHLVVEPAHIAVQLVVAAHAQPYP